MRKNFMKMLKIIFAVGALVLSAATSAVPVFTPTYAGKTTSGSDLISGTASGNTLPGYYLWNEESDTAQWHLRWTGLGLNMDPVIWFGGITFQESNLDGTVTEYQFEYAGAHADVVETFLDFSALGFDDVVSFVAATNNDGGIDGISFTLKGNAEIMEFELGSNFLSEVGLPKNVPGSGIYISDELNTPQVTWTNRDYMLNGVVMTGVAQQFEISVPSPATIGMLGAALVFVSFVARVRK